MNKKLKISLIVIGIITLIVGGFFINRWYHTRISHYTPQARNANCPKSKPIKGNAQSGIYHLPSGQFYDKTRPERCFANEKDAQEAGYRRSSK